MCSSSPLDLFNTLARYLQTALRREHRSQNRQQATGKETRKLQLPQESIRCRGGALCACMPDCSRERPEGSSFSMEMAPSEC